MTKDQLEKWVSQLMYGNPPTAEQQRWWELYKAKTKKALFQDNNKKAG